MPRYGSETWGEYAYAAKTNERYVKTVMNRDSHPLDLYWIVNTPKFFFVHRNHRRNSMTHSIEDQRPFMFVELWKAALVEIGRLYQDPSISPNA